MRPVLHVPVCDAMSSAASKFYVNSDLMNGEYALQVNTLNFRAKGRLLEA